MLCMWSWRLSEITTMSSDLDQRLSDQNNLSNHQHVMRRSFRWFNKITLDSNYSFMKMPQVAMEGIIYVHIINHHWNYWANLQITEIISVVQGKEEKTNVFNDWIENYGECRITKINLVFIRSKLSLYIDFYFYSLIILYCCRWVEIS